MGNEKVEDKPKRKKSPSRITKLKTELEAAKAEIESLKDQLLRKAADFENYKKRVQREFENLIKTANENLITDILPVLDDFERSLNFGKDHNDFNSFYEGVELIYKKLQKTLADYGLKPIESVGKEFNLELHEAVMQVESQEHPPNTVVEEHQKGYMLNDKVIRHAKVIVSKGEE